MSAAPLPERFARLWRRMGARDDGHAICGELLEAYQEPHRHYHGLDHLRDCLSQLDAAPRGAENRGATETALWFHDAVYDTRVHDNEARSAALAADALRDSGVQDDLAREVARLVRLTDHVRPAPDRLSALLCDIDLSILGRAPEEFAEYERRVRAEYAWVPESHYRSSRAAILARLLERESIYLTGHFRAVYEESARRNLKQSLRGLAGGPEQG